MCVIASTSTSSVGTTPHAPAQMDARFTPQQAVDRSLPTPADCDLTIVLLWSRMGTPLTETRADGTPYLSGTEWEFETALAANKAVYLYRRSEKVLLDPDEAEFDAKLTQKRRVDDFFAPQECRRLDSSCACRLRDCR